MAEVARVRIVEDEREGRRVSGAPDHMRSGDAFGPSQVYRRGISPPSVIDVLLNWNGIALSSLRAGK